MQPVILMSNMIGDIARTMAMYGARRHIRHARKLIRLLERRAEWLDIACYSSRAVAARNHAKAIADACDYIERRGQTTEAKAE